MKSVCIVGAGPGGLVAAKVLLAVSRAQKQPVKITILEKQSRVGGMWAHEPTDTRHAPGQKCGPNLRVNLSRFTVGFSDFSWQDAPLAANDTADSGPVATDDQHVPMYPYAWQVGRYLAAYAKRNISKECIRFSSEVTRASQLGDGDAKRWQVQWTEKSAASLDQHKSEEFDYLIVASGFFNQPELLAIPGSEAIAEDSQRSILHSSEFRSIQNLTSHTIQQKVKKIVVIGGSLSGSEAATAVAQQIANATYAPQQEERFAECQIYNITSKPFYAMPTYLPKDATTGEEGNNPAPKFLPLDLALYDLSRRPAGPIHAAIGLVKPEHAKMRHMAMQQAAGGDQTDLGRPELVFEKSEYGDVPNVAIADHYAGFIRDGTIVPILGRATLLERGDNDTWKVTVTRGDKAVRGPGTEIVIEDAAVIIYATGYAPHLAVSWLDPAALEAMEYDQSSRHLPLLLHSAQTFPKAVENLAFVGMYQGPYWGIMEMQARQVAAKWLTGVAEVMSSDIEKEFASLRELRQAMHSRSPQVPQFWAGDYTGIMEDVARHLGIERVGEQVKPCLHARYPSIETDKDQASRIRAELDELLDDATNKGRFVANVAFRGMHGKWNLTRTLTSKLPEFPLKSFSGTADFHPRNPTDPDYDREYLYIERGEARTHSGQVFQATRRYVYRYSERLDMITAWFVKEDGRTVDYLFNEAKFDSTPEKGRGWVARGDHLCIKDMYNSTSEFEFTGTNLKQFRIAYDVKGPSKDYVSSTLFERAPSAGLASL